MTEIIRVKQGDYGFTIKTTLVRADGTTFTIPDGATLTMEIYDLSGNKVATVNGTKTGDNIAEITIPEGTFDIATGRYKAVVVVTATDYKETSEPIYIEVW